MSAVGLGRARGQGFTLMEVLIALVLLSILMLVLTSALRTMGQTEERLEQRIEAADDLRLAMHFLRDALSRASARQVPRLQGERSALFEAASDSVAWVGVMPARYGTGGRHFMRLGLEQGPDGGLLILRYVRWDNQLGFPDWAQAHAQVILRDVNAVSFSYLDERSGRWTPRWPATDTRPRDPLPGAIQVQFESGGVVAPPLVVQLAALVPSDPAGSGGFVIGGTR